jgi:TPR repeat protein
VAEPVPTPTRTAFSAADANQLFVEGQKYLYGNGVERDCGRALEDLRVAARLSAEAASLLGTMYASGHCVGQNLAPAYHWYARALHRDPANTRYKSDLEVLWNQMTPQDRQAALRIAP